MASSYTEGVRGHHEVTRSTSSPRFLRIPLLDSPPVHSTLLPTSFARQRPAEESQQPLGGLREVLIRLALSFLAACAVVLCGSTDAQAAPIGMCADTAQSVEAPPPMFPADDAELKPTDEWTLLGCQADGEERFSSPQPGAPSDRIAPSYEVPDQKVILGELAPVLRSGSVPFTLVSSTVCLPEEHRWRGLRPPRI